MMSEEQGIYSFCFNQASKLLHSFTPSNAMPFLPLAYYLILLLHFIQQNSISNIMKPQSDKKIMTLPPYYHVLNDPSTQLKLNFSILLGSGYFK
jgi:hypothetical protein